MAEMGQTQLGRVDQIEPQEDACLLVLGNDDTSDNSGDDDEDED